MTAQKRHRAKLLSRRDFRDASTRAFVPRLWVLAALGGVFVLKLVVLLQLKGHPLTQPDAGLDTTAYVQLAQRVLDGNWGLGPGVYYVSPLYIYFLAIGLTVLKSFTAIRVVQIALGTASVAFLFLTTRIWFNERAAWIAGALAAFTGLFTFYEVLILQASIDGFLTSAALYFLARGLLPPEGGSHESSKSSSVASAFRRKELLLAGLIFGIQTLNRPNVMLAAAGVAVVMAVLTRRVRPAAVLAAGLLLGMAPVAVRNVIVARQFSLVSSHGGLNFYIGNSEEATGFYRFVAGVTPTIVGQEKDTRRIAERAMGRSLTDAEVSTYFFDLGLRWVREHPLDAAALFARKVGYAFHAQHIALPHSYPFYAYDAGTALRFYAVGPWLLTPLGLLGLLLCGPRDIRAGAYVTWASFVPLYAAAVAVFFVAERYRLPLLVPLCAGAGAAVDAAMQAVRGRRTSMLAGTAAAFVALFALANWPVNATNGRWIEGLRLAQQFVILKRYDEADRWARWLESHGPPSPGAGRYGLGAQFLQLDDAGRALPHLEAAHQASPGDARIDYDLGRALLKLGRGAEALPHLRHGFDAGIEIPGGGLDYAAALQVTGDLPAAAAAVRRINPADPQDEQAWLRLGRMAMEVKAPDVAEPFFRRAVQLRPGLAAARQQLGLNLLVREKFEEAARELSEAARLDPRDPDSLSHLAYCELKLGRVPEARAHAAAALALNPEDQLAKGIIRAGGS